MCLCGKDGVWMGECLCVLCVMCVQLGDVCGWSVGGWNNIVCGLVMCVLVLEQHCVCDCCV